MTTLHPVFDDILEAYVSPPMKAKALRFEVTVLVDGQARVVQTKASNAADAIINATQHFTEATRLTAIARPRGSK